MPFVIDGHNLLWSVRQSSEQGRSISEIQLCRLVGRYLKSVGQRGQIVFDGRGPMDKSCFNDTTNLEIVFAGAGNDADAVIEAVVSSSTAPRRLTVVSSDRRVRKAAKGRKAPSVKSDRFWTELCRKLARKSKPYEPVEKRRGLDESQTEHWLKYFGLDE